MVKALTLSAATPPRAGGRLAGRRARARPSAGPRGRPERAARGADGHLPAGGHRPGGAGAPGLVCRVPEGRVRQFYQNHSSTRSRPCCAGCPAPASRPAGWAPARGPAGGALPAGSASARTQRPPAAAGRRSARRAPPSRPPPSGADAARQLLHARASWPGHPGRARAADAAPRGARRRAPRSCRRRSSMRSPTCSPAARLTT